MQIHWIAVITGFVVTLVLGITSGFYAGSEAPVVLLSWSAIGFVGGLAAGYLAGGSKRSGALHGGMATLFGSLVLLAIATITALLFSGLIASFGVLIVGLMFLAFYPIPGIIGGVIGSWAKRNRTTPEPVGHRA